MHAVLKKEFIISSCQHLVCRSLDGINEVVLLNHIFLKRFVELDWV